MGEIAFRRIRGRIVPIRVSPEKKRQKPILSSPAKGMIKGAAAAAAGVGIAVEAGVQGNRFTVASAKAFVQGKRLLGKKNFDAVLKNGREAVPGMKFASAGAKTKYMKGVAQLRASKNAARIASIIFKGGPILASGLIAYGTTKFVSNYQKKRGKKLSPEMASVLGLSAGSGAFAAATARDFMAAGVHGRSAGLRQLGRMAVNRGLKIAESVVRVAAR